MNVNVNVNLDAAHRALAPAARRHAPLWSLQSSYCRRSADAVWRGGLMRRTYGWAVPRGRALWLRDGRDC